MIEFLDLFNKVARVARPAHHAYKPIDSMDILFEDTELDSLDMLMIGMYMSEIYGIDDAIAKTLNPKTPNEMLGDINQHKTKEPESVDVAMQGIK